MWIRSQDKKTLTMPRDIWIKGLIICAVAKNYDTSTTIGEFKTPEAALAELGRIQQWITDGAKGVYQVGDG